MLYAIIDYITFGAKFLTNNLLIFEFQRFHKEPWLMVCNFVNKFWKNSHFCTKAENLVSLWVLFTEFNPDFHLLCILEFRSKTVFTI